MILKEVHKATITLTSASLTSLEKAQAAISSILRDSTVPDDDYKMTIVIKSDFPMTAELREVEKLLSGRRGVDFKIQQTTAKEGEGDNGAPRWEETPLGKLSQTPREN